MDFGWGWKVFWMVAVALLIVSILFSKRHRDKPPQS